MEIKTYTKKDIATELAHRRGLSVRSSIGMVDDFFNIVRDFLTEDSPSMFRLIKRPGLNQEKS